MYLQFISFHSIGELQIVEFHLQALKKMYNITASWVCVCHCCVNVYIWYTWVWPEVCVYRKCPFTMFICSHVSMVTSARSHETEKDPFIGFSFKTIKIVCVNYFAKAVLALLKTCCVFRWIHSYLSLLTILPLLLDVLCSNMTKLWVT